METEADKVKRRPRGPEPVPEAPGPGRGTAGGGEFKPEAVLLAFLRRGETARPPYRPFRKLEQFARFFAVIELGHPGQQVELLRVKGRPAAKHRAEFVRHGREHAGYRGQPAGRGSLKRKFIPERVEQGARLGPSAEPQLAVQKKIPAAGIKVRRVHPGSLHPSDRAGRSAVAENHLENRRACPGRSNGGQGLHGAFRAVPGGRQKSVGNRGFLAVAETFRRVEAFFRLARIPPERQYPRAKREGHPPRGSGTAAEVSPPESLSEPQRARGGFKFPEKPEFS